MAIEKLQIKEKRNISIGYLIADDYDINELRLIGDVIKAKYPKETVVLIISGQNLSDKVNIVVSVSADLQNQYNAGKLLKSCIEFFGGKGGGNATFAQGAGTGKAKIEEAIRKFIELV